MLYNITNITNIIVFRHCGYCLLFVSFRGGAPSHYVKVVVQIQSWHRGGSFILPSHVTAAAVAVAFAIPSRVATVGAASARGTRSSRECVSSRSRYLEYVIIRTRVDIVM